MLKVLRISHTAVLSSYRARERALVSQFPVELQVIVPEKWQHLGAENSGDTQEPFLLHRAATLLSGNIPLFSFDAQPLIRVLKSFHPDVVDIHEEPYSVSGFQCAFLTKMFVPDAGMMFYTAQNIHKNYPPPFAWTEKYVYAACAAAYPCSEEAATVIRNKGYKGLAPVLPLGIDDTKFNINALSKEAREESRSREGLSGFVLGYFGRIESYKGIQYLFEALSKIDSPLDCCILIVGTGSYRVDLEALAKRLGVSERIHWVGEKPAGSVQEWMALCDCVVIPSLTTKKWKEQFGRVVVEAMALGVPTISSDSGSLPEVTKDAGLIVAEANSDELCRAITALIRDEKLRGELIAKGLDLVAKKYTWNIVAKQMFDIYCSISKRKL